MSKQRAHQIVPADLRGKVVRPTGASLTTIARNLGPGQRVRVLNVRTGEPTGGTRIVSRIEQTQQGVTVVWRNGYAASKVSRTHVFFDVDAHARGFEVVR